MKYLKEYRFEIIIISLIVLFFGTILYNKTKHREYIHTFQIKCETKGGITYIPKGVKGWPEPLCMNPDVFIDMKK